MNEVRKVYVAKIMPRLRQNCDVRIAYSESRGVMMRGTFKIPDVRRPVRASIERDSRARGRHGVLFLCSDLASLVTGADLAVDGGYCAMGPDGAMVRRSVPFSSR